MNRRLLTACLVCFVTLEFAVVRLNRVDAQTTDAEATTQQEADESPTAAKATNQDAGEADSSTKADQGWKPLDGHWKVCDYGGDGKVQISKELIKLGAGTPMTGVHWEGKFPRDQFELRLEARRTDGRDFFCGTTFPVGEGKCSLILGGWGGGVLGLSSIDGMDASENSTTQFMNFENGKWYKIRIRVDPQQITCWIDDEAWVEQERDTYKFDVRIEMDPTLPVGFANYDCTSELRKIEWRSLTSTNTEDRSTATTPASDATADEGQDPEQD